MGVWRGELGEEGEREREGERGSYKVKRNHQLNFDILSTGISLG